MPLFDWSSNQVISPHFYIYWAFTGPLAVLVLAVYAAWTWFKTTQHANEDDAGGYSLSSPTMSSAQPPQSPISEARRPQVEQVTEQGRGQSSFKLAMPFDSRE